VIVNGPIARELGMNGGHNAFGPCNAANATIGRAIRLALLNIGGATPGLGDMSTMGSPAKYSFAVAENEAENPWEPLGIERGFEREASTVTVIGAEPPHNVNDHESQTAEGILKTIAGTLATTGNNDVYYATSRPLVIFGPEHAKTVAGDGYTKARVREFIYEHARVPLGRFARENVERRFKVNFRERYANAGPDAPVPMLGKPENLLIAVIGGAGKHSAVVPTFGSTEPVTRALKTKDGRLAKSVGDFRR
jgi:hypothetical protein